MKIDKTQKKQVMFVSSLLLILFIIFAAFSIFYSSSSEAKLSCSKVGSEIRCQWKNCQLNDQGNELIIAKTPNFVQTTTVTEVSGSAIFSPQETAGTYTLVLSCGNTTVQQLVIG